MNLRKLAITAVLSTGILLLGSVFASSVLPSAALAAGHWSHSDGAAGFARHGGMDSLQSKCERMDATHVKYAGAFASAFLDLDTDQRTALEPVLDALRGWATEINALCPSLANESVADRMTSAQAFLTVSADAMGELRLAYEQFEPVLSDAQRQTLTEAMEQHGRRRGQRNGRW